MTQLQISVVFFNDTATTEIYTLSLHDALPICAAHRLRPPGRGCRSWSSRRSPSSSPRPTPTSSSWPCPTSSPESGDRKSTRLNSSHANISYAVFCLKKKNKYLYRFLLRNPKFH